MYTGARGRRLLIRFWAGAAALLAALVPSALVLSSSAAAPVTAGKNGDIFFTSGADEGNGAGSTHIWRMHPDGTWAHPLTTSDGNDYGPSVSPDGQYVVYVGVHTDGRGLFVMRADGSDQRQLSQPQLDTDADPSWSPDGQHIVFTRYAGGGVSYPYIMNANGAHKHRIGTINHGYGASYTPDGQHIILGIVHTNPHDGAIMRAGIFTLTVNGTHLHQLTHGTHEGPPFSYSPDGRHIAFVRRASIHDHIYTMNADGTHQTAITGGPFDDYCPAWSPDGHDIMFSSDRDGSHKIWEMGTNGMISAVLLGTGGYDEQPSWKAKS